MRLGVEVAGLGDVQGGVARFLWGMLESMLDIDPALRVWFYTVKPIVVPLPEGRWHLRLHSGWRSRPYEAWMQVDLPRMLAEDNMDLFWGHCHYLPWRLQHDCPRVLTIHDLTSVLYRRTMFWRTRLTHTMVLRRAARTADRVVADSRATARLCRLLLGVRPERLRVVYPGLAKSIRCDDRDEALRLVRCRLGLPERFMLCVGTLEPRKGHRTLLTALSLVRNAPLLVIVGGRGWQSRGIVDAVQRHEAAGTTRYLGHVSDEELSALYGAAVLSVYPSRYEGFGLPVLEAMACGCPVLCSWSSSLPEVGGRAARYFRPGDVRDLARQLESLLNNPEGLRTMAAMGRVQATNFDREVAARQMLELFESLLPARNIRPGRLASRDDARA